MTENGTNGANGNGKKSPVLSPRNALGSPGSSLAGASAILATLGHTVASNEWPTTPSQWATLVVGLIAGFLAILAKGNTDA
jgi:hypothetical protein